MGVTGEHGEAGERRGAVSETVELIVDLQVDRIKVTMAVDVVHRANAPLYWDTESV